MICFGNRIKQTNTCFSFAPLQHQLHEVDAKYREAMISNAQLDNEKQSYVYQVDWFKDEMEEIEENYIRSQRDLKEKSKVILA